MSNSTIQIANTLQIPANTKAILFDLDGVILDSLSLDVTICNKTLPKLFGPEVQFSQDYYRTVFAFAPKDFTRMVLEKVEQDFGYKNAQEKHQQLTESYCQARETEKFPKTPGIELIFADLKAKKIPKLLVSNNSTRALENILANCDLTNEFPEFVPNDLTLNGKPMQKKPAPDPYLIAIKKLELTPNECVVIEDSLEGCQSGKSAGCYVIGVATGGATLAQLNASPNVDQAYESFASAEI